MGAINVALALGQNLILTPGVYDLSRPIVVTRPGTVVMGLGFATLIPQDGNVAMETANVPGIKLSGMIFDAGPRNSAALLVVGTHGRGGWRYGRAATIRAPRRSCRTSSSGSAAPSQDGPRTA